jgi:hypothetical protein
MVVLTVIAVACGTAGDMVGEMMDSGVPDAGAQDTPVQCRDGNTGTFTINPGQTEATVCHRSDNAYEGKSYCIRVKVPWFEGTSEGFMSSCATVTSVTLHN